MAQEVIITYETLFELLQRERERAELQKIEPTFFHDTISYIKDKKKIIEATRDDSNIFALEERKKTERQLENIYKIVKELYERREKKIIAMALDKSRMKINIIDTSSMLKEEKVIFDSISGLLDNYRDSILYSVLNEKMPFMESMKQMYTETKPVEKTHKQTTKLVRFLGHVPKFVGTELEEYGPFEEEDIANLQIEIADILIGKGKAEEIRSE